MLEQILRRHQRLLVGLAVFMVVVIVSTYSSTSSWGSNHVQKHLKKIPKFFWNPTCPPLSPAMQYGDHTYKFMSNIKSVEELSKFAVKDQHGNYFPPDYNPAEVNRAPRAKAAFISLVRNSELGSLKESMFDCMSFHHWAAIV